MGVRVNGEKAPAEMSTTCPTTDDSPSEPCEPGEFSGGLPVRVKIFNRADSHDLKNMTMGIGVDSVFISMKEVMRVRDDRVAVRAT